MLVLVIGSMIGFILFNLRIFGKKRGVFLGDSGSNLIGFWVAWCAIYASQNSFYNVQPITMLWFVAIPFLDCIGLIFSRIRRGVSWMSPGRDHIHHKLLRHFSPEGALFLILVITLVTGLIGIYIENNSSPGISLLMFITYAFIYYVFAGYDEDYKNSDINKNV